MITVHEAQNLVKENMHDFSLGSVEVLADRDYPPFHRVMMDGIALKFSDYESGVREFKISGIVQAGMPEVSFISGCMEVMTGAPLPRGADLVIQYEHLEIQGGVARITNEVPRVQFESIHLKGSDCKEGEVVLRSNSVRNGPHVGIMTSMGAMARSKSPRAMIISTGDELVEKDPLPHQIRRSNAYALKCSLELFGYHEVELSHLQDDPQEVASHFEKHAADFDLMIYSGGVSKGKFDYLPHVWADLGVTRHFHGVAQKPGKPLWFGTDEKRKTVIVGLPGNPVSSLVCLHRYILPQKEMSVKLTELPKTKGNLTHFIPVKLKFVEGVVLATPLKIKNSGEFTALAQSDGFIEFSGENSSYTFFPWRPL